MQEPTFLILTALAAGPQHGYGIMTDVAQISAGRVRLRAGTLYAALDRLGEERQLELDHEEIVDARLRRYYRLTPTFAHDLDGMLAHASASTTLVYICNPNNPTASLTPRKDLENFISKLPASTFVVIDEAYHHYVGQTGMYASFIDRPLDDRRVIVARTFSNVYGLAGLRLGYAVGSPKIIQQMRKFATEDNINEIVTQAAGAALDDTDAINDFIQRNADDRQEFFNQAMARSLRPIDSHTNFVMMDTFRPAEEVIEHLCENNILIGRRFPPMDTYIRISLGRPEEMRAFWRAWDMLRYPKNFMQH
jgi:histidinol-phosphate aminotransferase